MKRAKLIKLIMICLLLDITVKAQFIHPGLISTQAELNKIKSNVNGVPAHPMKQGYQKLLASAKANLSYASHPYSVVHVVGSGSNAEEKAFHDDAVAAYAHALQWMVSGNAQHSVKAIQIMNDWAKTLTDVVPATAGDPSVQDELETDWYAPIWLAAAEIIRYYNNGAAGWSSADIAQFNKMVTLFETKANNWQGSQGCCPNQAISAVFARVSAAVYKNDITLFNNAIAYLKNSVLGRAIAGNGEILELNRLPGGDCGHAQYNIEGLFDIAEIAWHQGDDLYTFKLSGDTTPRLLKGLEYLADCIMNGTQTTSQGIVMCSNDFPVSIEIAFNHYINRSGGYSLPKTQNLLFNKTRPSDGNSGKFIPWDTFTHADLDKTATPTDEQDILRKEFKAYPNPFRNTTYISFDSAPSTPYAVIISDVFGSEVKRITDAENPAEISTYGLSDAIYFYKVTSGDNIIGSGKLIVNR